MSSVPPAGNVLVDADELATSLVIPAQREDADACAICLGPLLDSLEVCENCVEHHEVLEAPPALIVPVAVYHRDTVLRQWVTGYKSDLAAIHLPSSADEEYSRAALRTILEKFFVANQWLLVDIDQVVVVPSTVRPPPHPLEELLNRSSAGKALGPVLLSRTSAPLGARTPNTAAYAADKSVAEQRVLLVDDVYASGARLQSAAGALRAAGAIATKGVVIARRMNPDYDPRVQAMWARQSKKPFRWEREPVTRLS